MDFWCFYCGCVYQEIAEEVAKRNDRYIQQTHKHKNTWNKEKYVST